MRFYEEYYWTKLVELGISYKISSIYFFRGMNGQGGEGRKILISVNTLKVIYS